MTSKTTKNIVRDCKPRKSRKSPPVGLTKVDMDKVAASILIPPNSTPSTNISRSEHAKILFDRVGQLAADHNMRMERLLAENQQLLNANDVMQAELHKRDLAQTKRYKRNGWIVVGVLLVGLVVLWYLSSFKPPAL